MTTTQGSADHAGTEPTPDRDAIGRDVADDAANADAGQPDPRDELPAPAVEDDRWFPL